ncbi:S-Ena type endospore appendage [Cytobacillus firmus]|uniref:S-Ena type endospore appendage n=1 Tax=Cytobacillus firmus TaxID=1399 RepID=UPI003002BC55
MGCSKGCNNACCPTPEIFQEKICGNFNGGTAGIELMVWQAVPGDYFEGTFEIFNSASSSGSVTGDITAEMGETVVGPVPQGNSVANSVLEPSDFTISAPPNTSGKFCITLYKRVMP